MAQGLALVADLENAIATGSPARRTQILRAVTDLFVASRVQSHDETAIFDDVIGRIAQHMEVEARAELARRLAPLAHAPADVVNALAQDEAIAVAGPLLMRSSAVREDTIVAAAQTRGQEHLLAISRRGTLSEAVTDALVTRGNAQVVRSTAGNTGARFSDAGFNTLVTKSHEDTNLAVVVGTRLDVPAQHLERLIAEASQVTRDKLAGAHPHLSEVVATVIAKVAARVRENSVTHERDYADAYAKIEGLKLRGPIAEQHILAFSSRMMFEETAVAIATLAGIPLDTVEKTLLSNDIDQALIMTRALNLSWPTVKSVLHTARQAAGGPKEDFSRASAHFERIQVTTAQRILRFYLTRLNNTA